MEQVETRTAMRGAQFVDPVALGRIRNLELLARTVVDGFINGLHRAPHLGFSLDFAEHRGYEPGDDLRRVDWRVFARTDRFYVKQFEADSNANIVVALDISPSMRFTSGGVTKLDYGRYLAASLLYFSHQQRDRVGLVTFDQEVVEYVPPSARHLDYGLYALDRIAEARPGTLAAPMLTLTERLKRRGIVAIVSDLYEEPDAVASRRAAAQVPRPRRDRVPRARPGRAGVLLRRLGELRGSRDRRSDADRAGRAAQRVPDALCSGTSRRSGASSPTAGLTTPSSKRRCRSITLSFTTSPRGSG